MPLRIVREGILESERVDLLSHAAEVLYRRAMSKVDDYGRYYAKTELVIAALYPLRIGRVTAHEIEEWLKECVEAALIRIYVVEGKQYLEILDFRQQLRSKSKFPDPPPVDQHLPSNCAADATQKPIRGDASAHLFVVESVSVSGAKRAPCARDTQTFSPEFEEAWRQYPRREGGNSKKEAWKAWRARIVAGAKPTDLLEGTRRYAVFIRSKGNEGTPFVKQAATFYGSGEHFMEEWAVQAAELTRNSGIEMGAVL